MAAGPFDLNSIILYALGFIGIALIFLTRYVMKGKARDMTNLWFVTFFAYFIFYTLASSKLIVNDTGANIGYAIIWPIPAILGAWVADKIEDKESTKLPVIKWLTYLLFGIVFAFLVDGGAGLFGWYTYNPELLKTVVVNPIGGISLPAVVPLILGILLMVLVELVDRLRRIMGRKAYNTQSTLLICGLSVLLGALAWTLVDIVLGML